MAFHDAPSDVPDPEVVPKAKRRKFTAEYKRRILEEADSCTEAGQLGALLRREGLYSSHLSTWRRQRDRGVVKGLSPKKRGRKRKDELEREVARLQRENERLHASLEEAEMIIDVQKKTLAATWSGDGGERERKAQMIAAAEELGESVGVSKACRVLTVPRSRLYRERRPKRPSTPRPTPKRALSQEEKAEVHQTLNSERFQDCPPREVYATLLDEGTYLCDWRTMYRILGEYGEVQERRNQLQHPTYSKPELLATAPNQVWSWDITKLRGPFPRICYYLYVILDIFSRYVVGWMIAESESGDLAKELIMATCAKEEVAADQLALHADRGSPMKSKSVGQLLADLEVAKSFSRPHTPDDNPYSEAQFKTMKYQPDYPGRFESQDEARGWARDFIHWYNHEHYHTGLALMTPAMVHHGLAEAVYAHRQQVLQAAYEAHPERFVRGMPTPPALPKEVWINQPQSGTVECHNPAAVPAPDPTQPGAQAMSRVAAGQAKRSLDTGEHLATVGKMLEQPNRTESFDTNISLELSQNA